jgi:hypothetical protein
VEAVVYNKAMLAHMIKDYSWKELCVLLQTLLGEDSALVLPSGSLLRAPLHRAVLHLPHSPAWKATGQR